MKVKDIMTGGCNYCAPTDNVMDVAKLMRQDDYGAVPVAEQDKLETSGNGDFPGLAAIFV